MQTTHFLLVFSFFIPFLFFTQIQGFEPAPAPVYKQAESPSLTFSFAPVPAHINGDGINAFSPKSPVLAESQAPIALEKSGAGSEVAQSPESDEKTGDIPVSEVEDEGSEKVVRWCAVREEVDECQSLVNLLKESTYSTYTWTCINKDTTQQCLESIKKGEADIINVEAGMAYTAFTTYSMKAIANEIYCDRSQSYDAVVLVNRKSCQEKQDISLIDFKGQKSCHGGYFTAAGWNYPISHISRLFGSQEMNDQEIAENFFAKVCSPSEFEGKGVCSGCGNENGTCDSNSNSLYYGHSGAFRCLMEELGDLAFVKSDTPLLYSMEGPYNQSWSSKSIRDFMYLCPKGGCREINGYPGSCSFGTVPANAIMASNSIPNEKKLHILQTLTNATLRDALLDIKKGWSHLITPSMQEISVVKKLTRSYLGNSASVSENILQLNAPITTDKPSIENADSDQISVSSCNQQPIGITFLSVVAILNFMMFFCMM